MKEMIKKIREDKGGFTLAELLIVVAIIAILVAIAIPVFTNALTKAQTATAEADIRVAKAEAATDYLLNDGSGTLYYTVTMDKSGNVKSITKSTSGTATEVSDVVDALNGSDSTITIVVGISPDEVTTATTSGNNN